MAERGPITPEEASRLTRRIQAIAEKRLAAMTPENEPTFACPDCLDRGWLIVPCGNPGGKCVECIMRSDHEVARACLSCEPGVQREAGVWFRWLYTRDRKGSPTVIGHRVPKFEQAMLRLGAGAKRVQLALDAIIDREKAARTAARTPKETP